MTFGAGVVTSGMSMSDAELARRIAAAAGQILVAIRNAALLDGKALGDAGDRFANAFIIDALRTARPGDALLSEEDLDDLTRTKASRVWIVDPLDGTAEYREGRDDWAVHVGLAMDGVATAGAVALPAIELTFDTGAPAELPDAPETLRMIVSRTRPPAIALAVAERMRARVVSMGSAGAKAMAVVRGEADIYLHTGGQHQWDNCAPVAVALAAGLHASRIDGSPLVYNKAETLLPDLLICRRAHAEAILALVAEISASRMRAAAPPSS